MNQTPTYRDGKIYIPVLGFTEGAGEALIDSLGGEGTGPVEVPLGARTAVVELFRFSETAEGADAVISKADAALLLIRFLDQVTMTRIKEVFHLAAAEAFLPKTVALFRNEKESEFKISCSYCGQKLWVRDRDAGRRGNCPQCRKTFFVPTQKSYVTSYLMLTEEVPVVTVNAGDASARNAIAALAERVVSMEEGSKSSTMRIELPPEETGS
ncbi:MAG TPA: hypothetical protein PKC67_02760 [Kiritimatiellia bacterium]|nr:hypothetical protein [Kiritimatiellia bacterium]HMP33248.1 hypothetical protein [Kiritimatiellia bacterium]